MFRYPDWFYNMNQQKSVVRSSHLFPQLIPEGYFMTCGFHSVEEGHFIGMMIRFQINLGIHIPQYLHNEILSIPV